METIEDDIRWLRIKLAEAKTEHDKKYILKQLELLESTYDPKTQVLLTD